MADDFALVPKILPALRRLRGHYERKGKHDICRLIEESVVYIEPETEFDNWNGGTYGHDVRLFVSDDLMALIDLDKQSELFESIRADLNKVYPDIENEYVRAFSIGPYFEADPEYQAGVPFSMEPIARPEDVGLWRGNALRLFISHRDGDKELANTIASLLDPVGVSSFVAHDAIKPMREWQKEILNGLLTMEVMLVLLTDEFHESVWTNQEVGFALARNIPIVILKTGKVDPRGFISNKQAIKIPYEAVESEIHRLKQIIIKEVGHESRVKASLIDSFIGSANYSDAMTRLQSLVDFTDRLNDREFRLIVEGYYRNDQLHNCNGIHNRGNWFKRYLEAATGKRLEFSGKEITEANSSSDKDFPF
ncbi:toll/interleukin-1 receptor domain-containing protein [Glycocaulis profundi]|nr:toll/interleukin-1 receptor domain-containing protein [Glycocaulis profundi]